MLGKCVLWVSGIVNKQIQKVDHVSGYNLYMLKKDIKNNNDYGMIFIEYDNHYFHISNNLIKTRDVLLQNPSFDLMDYLNKSFEQQLKDGRVNKGLAEYFGREEEAKQAVERNIRQKELERYRKEEERRRRELEVFQAEKKRLEKVSKEYINGDAINSSDFLTLCDNHNVKIPIRTRGWIKSSLYDISYNSEGTRVRYSGNMSKSIGSVASELYDAITGEYVANSDNLRN